MIDRRGAVFEALADPTRRQVLSLVGRHGPVTATELAEQLPVSRQAVAKHLDALRTAGLVESDRHGRDVRFGLKPEGLDRAAAWMDEVGAGWDRRLEALTRRASNRRRPH
ncbi:MAG TPA: metalloregulator ArsR/SmtB family transcription factor [Acidimicrobiales bacterium]|jgi:DNA-binding transcriptional ArsR family regulator|nr:metalloregulator ArsR/SmtB family transcription factor [Acidimicrobiales bacterium]